MYNEIKNGVCGLEFLLIGESKLKVVLNEEEAKKYGLDKGGADCRTTEVRRSFWRVLDIARDEVGFDPAGDKVLIQMYPSSQGGCELFVTKLGILPPASARLVARSDRIALLSKKQSFYAFESLDDLVSCARAIRSVCSDGSVTSDVYYAYGRYFLAIDEYARGGEAIEFPCILEFGRMLSSDFGAYISEHANSVAHISAIEIFSRL